MNNNEPAFPMAAPEGYAMAQEGMTLRDWFAGQALAGLTANHKTEGTFDDVAYKAYALADAMLFERTQ